MKDLGPLTYVFGIVVECSLVFIYLCQWNYTLETISEASLFRYKPASSVLIRIIIYPKLFMTSLIIWNIINVWWVDDLLHYYMYWTCLYWSCMGSIYAKSLKKIIAMPLYMWTLFLKGKTSLVILLKANTPLVLICYSDFYSASCPLTWRFVTRYLFLDASLPFHGKIRNNTCSLILLLGWNIGL